MFEFNHFPEAIAALVKAIASGVGSAADDMAADASARAPQASGFLASTVYVVTATENTYGQNVGTPPGDSYLLPISDELPSGPCEAIVGVAANYGVFVELGTRHMAPEPFLGPAAEHAAQDFEAHFTDVESQITGAIG